MVKRLKHKLGNAIKTRKLNVFLLFLLFACFILVLSKLTKTYTKTFAFSTEITHLPQELVRLQGKNQQLDITLKAQGYNLLKYYFGSPKLELDYKRQVKVNDSAYIWSRNAGFSEVNEQFGKSIELLSVTPDTLFFEYDINTVKKVPIVLNIQTEFKQGYDLLETYSLEPDSVTIVGPKSVVETVDFLRTDSLNLLDVEKNISTRIGLKLPKAASQLKISSTQILLQGEVEKFTEGSLTLPVMVKNVPDGLHVKLFPKTVTVTYYTSLSNYKHIEAKDFLVECDYLSVSSNRQYLVPILIKKPKLVKNARINQNRIEFVITE
ncbi:MAG TPA: YbbR-like domain-containing protein [Flavobacteriaceae bacterium]|nr:YbbR-like domain-containing protein [Flavobacteriaceae bacterium]